MAEPLLAIEDVYKSYERAGERNLVLSGVSLTITSQKIVTVVAKTDQGKTTLLNVAAGMEPVDRGSVRLAGRDLSVLNDGEMSEVLRTQIGFATRTGPCLDWQMRDYVSTPLRAGSRVSGRERDLRVAEVMDRLGVADCATRQWHELSGWRRVRVELAQAIVGRPKLVLVDDLLDGLSHSRLQETMHLIHELANEFSFSVLMAASDYNAAALSDQVWNLNRGTLSLAVDHTTPAAAITDLDTRRRKNAS
jgi:putative ABC transport system ATP-binding protein